jgi:membrane protease YdiL (CAAX protease family)
MPDPTFIIMSCSFLAAFVVFATAGLISMARKRAVSCDFDPDSEKDSVSGDDLPSCENSPPVPQHGGVAIEIYKPWDLIGVALLFVVFTGLVLSVVSMKEDSTPVLNAQVLLSNIAFQFIIAGLVMLFVLGRIGLVSWLGLRWADWPLVFLLAPGTVVLMWVLTGGLHLSGYLKWMESLGVETTQDTVKLLRETQDPQVLGLMVFAAVIAAPLCEEIVFRGYLYPVLKRFSGVWVAAFSSSLFFAAAHGNLMALLPLFIFGGLLVLLYEKTGSIWPPIAAHFCFNSATVAVQMAVRHYDIPIGTLP